MNSDQARQVAQISQCLRASVIQTLKLLNKVCLKVEKSMKADA